MPSGPTPANPRAAASAWLMSAPALLLVTLALLAPLSLMLVTSLQNAQGHLSGENYRRLLEPLYLQSAWITLKLAVAVTACCALCGYPLSYYLSRLTQPKAAWLMILVLLPFWTSVLVRTYAWLILLQRRGLVNNFLRELGLITDPLHLVHNFLGTVIGMTHVLLPFLVLPLYSAMRAIPGDYTRAALSLGASPTRAFWQIFFPLSFPGLAAGGLLVFILSLGFFVTPSLLGGGKVSTWPVLVDSALSIYPHPGAASALGVALLIMTLVFVTVLRAVQKRLFKAAGARL